MDRSAELFRRAAEVRHEDFQSLILLAQCLSVLGQEEESKKANKQGIRRAERARELDPADSRALSLGALALEKAGDPDRALQWIRRALELYPDDQSVLINAACLHACLGLKEEAIDFLEKTFARGW